MSAPYTGPDTAHMNVLSQVISFLNEIQKIC